ncbi:MAG: carotenoid biosynthesis protein, partial [Gemmatimonadota bacterium]|nr:carotenoid biosynthesis protein [Gemmatimonadota bacterium]
RIGQVQVWLLWAVLAAVLIRHTGVRWVPAFAAVYVLSFLSEFFGTGYGIPFGGYAYTALLGGKWFGQVPYVIPLSWFAMAIPSFALARAFGVAGTPVRRLLVASAILVAWDLALDPAMSHLTPYWVWSDSGPYYGMPWLNLLGWYVTGLVLMGALTLLRADRWIDRLDLRWLGAYYGVNILMPVGMMAAAGMWLGVLVTLTVYVLLAAVALVPPSRTHALTTATNLMT